MSTDFNKDRDQDCVRVCGNYNNAVGQIIIWQQLSAAQQRDCLARPHPVRDEHIAQRVSEILLAVKARGDEAVREFSRQFDGFSSTSVTDAVAPIDAQDMLVALRNLDPDLEAAMRAAKQRIEAFHQVGMPRAYAVETAPGVTCERMVRAIDTVGLYVPAGSAPLFSTVMMLAVPAVLAGCQHIVLCAPRQSDGRVNASILAAAKLCGVRSVYGIGGAQAIAAMAYGTESIPRCDKIFGPGNAYVNEAKRQVARDALGAAIDLPAGPSEVLVIADQSANATVIAADLLAQAEHGPDSQVILITDCVNLARAVQNEIALQTRVASRAQCIVQALQHARIIVVQTIKEAIDLANRYAPEHLILNVANPRQWLDSVRAAGSVFLGPWAAETLGDYCSGTNHVLPTDGAARAYSGVSVASFCRQITVQTITMDGLLQIGEEAITMAQAEDLQAHANAVRARLAMLQRSAA